MKLPERGEKGFTLIELLIVIAILGVLAAVVVPNVSRFVGRGQTEAAATELSTVQAAVSAMIIDKGITATVQAANFTSHNSTGTATSDMSDFPDANDIGAAIFAYGSGNATNYIQQQNTRGTYYIDERNGTVYQATTGY